jgi:adenylate cyclase
MQSKKLFSLQHICCPHFLIALSVILFVYLLYGANIIGWRKSPNFGWRTMYNSGPNIVAEVFTIGNEAGLRVGDKIIAINGKTYSTFDELFFKVRHDEPGSVNTYTVQRDGKTKEISITTGRLGILAVIKRSVPIFIIGFIYVMMGIIVFVMKPQASESWLFLVMTSFIGMSISLDAPSDLMQPLWLYDIRLLIDVFLPASIIHFALRFPKTRQFLHKRPWLCMVPYLLSLILFFLCKITSSAYWNIPVALDLVNNVYLMSSILIFLASIIWNLLTDTSIIRLQSRIILLGISLGLFIPTIELLTRNLWGIGLFPNPALNFAFFLSIFPLSIGYTIVKHNLFDVDVYIKRAVGYGIMVVLVVMAEYSMNILSKPFLVFIFGEYAEKIYPFLFALLFVLLFRSVNNKVQGFVDKLFFRKKFDYKDTVLSVSNALCSVLNLDEIIKRIIHTVRKEMFIDTAGVVLLEPQSNCCRTVFDNDKPGNKESSIKDVRIPCDNPLLSLVKKEKKLITKYDLEKDPHYVKLKNSCEQLFEEIGASMVMPLIYQNKVKGVLALGYKKSGHFYTREDIDLLETLTNQGAIAIENARLAEQMEKELIVRTNLSRYISPQVVEQIIKKDRQVNLGGSKKNVTVLISDIRHFTRITETYSPDKLVHILNEYFTEMAKIIFENQGSLDKYIGDAIVAVFGSLITLENAAQSAIRAAIQMMKRMNALNESWMQNYRLVMNIGIGINTGEVFLGNVGSPERMEFTVIGDTVNVASRFSDIAKEGQILISKNTLASLSSDIKYKELPPTAVKGKTGKLEVFEILYS